MSETRVIYIESNEADLMQSYLDSEGEDRVGTIQTYTAVFNDNVEADIKVCNGNPPFVDAVLYDGGTEVELREVTDELLGEYVFFYKGKIYTVMVEEGIE
jgi:molybdopterin biosynthesis enzyme MoaB